MNRIEKKRLMVLMTEFDRILQSYHCFDVEDFRLLYQRFYSVIYERKELDLFPRVPVKSSVSVSVSDIDDQDYLSDIARGELIYNRIHNKL